MDKEKMLAMRLDGCTYRQIGEEAGLSEQYIQQLLSPPKPIREYIIKKYNGRCANCGILITGKSAHVHHKDHTDNHYNDIDNLELLCPSCHRGKHQCKRKLKLIKTKHGDFYGHSYTLSHVMTDKPMCDYSKPVNNIEG